MHALLAESVNNESLNQHIYGCGFDVDRCPWR